MRNLTDLPVDQLAFGVTPKHTQLRLILQQLVRDELQVGDVIPSERHLAERFAVSRMTVRQAIEQLVSAGLLQRVPGRGTFVANQRIELPLQLRSFSSEMLARGLHPGSRVLAAATVSASVDIAAPLELTVGDPVHRIERLRTVDDMPVALECSHVPAEIAPDLLANDLADGSLYDVLRERYGVVLDRGEQTIAATAATAREASLLGIAQGAPVLALIRLSRTATRTVEYVESRYRGDRYRLYTPLVIGSSASEKT